MPLYLVSAHLAPEKVLNYVWVGICICACMCVCVCVPLLCKKHLQYIYLKGTNGHIRSFPMKIEYFELFDSL